jgi:ATP-dependent protease ClpP protease subunit
MSKKTDIAGEKDLIEDILNDSQIQKIQEINNTYIFNIDEDVNEPSYYRSMYHILLTATEKDTIILNLNTDGGYMYTALQLVDHLQKTEAHTIARVYNAYSAGSIIMLSCREVILNEFSTAMIHAPSGGYSGKHQEMKSFGKFSSKHWENVYRKSYAGFLTEKEMEEVLNGADIWLESHQLQKKLQNYYNFLEKRSQEYIEKENDKKEKKSNSKKKKKK